MQLLHIYFLTHSCANPTRRTTEPDVDSLWRIDRLDLKRGDLGATFISIHALRGEGDNLVLGGAGVAVISIHALRGEGDKVRFH